MGLTSCQLGAATEESPVTSAFLMSLCIVTAQAPEKADPDRARLEGSWKVVAATAQGEDAPAMKGMLMTFRKDRLVITEGGKKSEGIPYRLDSSKAPKQLDVEITLLQTAGWMPGIYS